MIYACMCLYVGMGSSVYVWQPKHIFESSYSPFTMGSGIKVLKWSSCLCGKHFHHMSHPDWLASHRSNIFQYGKYHI